MVLTQVTKAWVTPLKWHSGDNVSDHDRVGISLGKWNIGKVEVDKGCKGWGKKQSREFKLLMSKWAKGRVLSKDVVKEYEELKMMMMAAFEQVEVKCPAQGPKGEKQWEKYIRDMERLARRNPKIFSEELNPTA